MKSSDSKSDTENLTNIEKNLEPANHNLKESDPKDFEIQVHLAEYNALTREHDLQLKMRQELGIYTLAATAALTGAFIGQVTRFADFRSSFLILPFLFTFLTWWYIRTNYSAAMMEFYILNKLRPRLSQLSDAEVMSWIKFLYEIELSTLGHIVLGLQTISKFGLIQGPAILSLLIFGFLTEWKWRMWSFIDWTLIIFNILGITISIILAFLTRHLILRIKANGTQK